jgi:hypothetical protein
MPHVGILKKVGLACSCALLSTIICSCSKNSLTPSISHSNVQTRFQSLSTEEVRARYVAAMDQLGAKANFIGNPVWEDLSRILPADDKVPMIVVPLTGYKVNKSYSQSMNPNGYRELVFTPAPSGSLSVFVVEIHPDSLETITSHPSQNQLLSGYYLTYSLENNLQQGHHRTNGIADKFLEVPNTIFSNHEIFKK